MWDAAGGYRNDGPFTPFYFHEKGDPPKSTIQFPGGIGGVNWGGVAVDPEQDYIFVNSKDEATIGWMVPNPRYNEKTASSQEPYIRGSGQPFAAPHGDGTTGTWPCYAPPWARLMAIDGNTGDIAWSVPLGIDASLPEGKQHVGSPGYGGPIVTAGGLVFIGATSDRRFRAFDSHSGKELWSYEVPHNITAVPMTYAGNDGRQYVAVVAARGGKAGKEGLFVFAWPRK
jgi:quinoprotein glucose dehydrogenase